MLRASFEPGFTASDAAVNTLKQIELSFVSTWGLLLVQVIQV